MNYDMLFIGVDVSKQKHDVALMNEHKTCVQHPFVIRENRAGFSSLVDRLASLKATYHTKSFNIGMEATGDYWKNLFHFLSRFSDYIPVVINPVKTRAFAKTELRRAKTDAVNAKDIALFLVEKRTPKSYYRAPVFDNIKDMDTQVQAFNKQLTMTTNRLRIELGKVAPEIEQSVRNIRSKQLLALLMHFPTAAAITQASLPELSAIRFGNKKRRILPAFFLKLQELSQESIAYKSEIGVGAVVQSLVRTILHFQMEVESLKRNMTQLYEHTTSNNAAFLSSVKGISNDTAIVLDAYFGDLQRFNNAKQFVAFFGMNPVINQSGNQTNRNSYLEKKGSAAVRRKLFYITLTLIREQVEPFSSFYKRLIVKGKPKLVAIGATMRKLLGIMFQMIVNQQKFDPDRYKNS
ncbi:IS110 family transposase [candidate division KSB1 bacterium]|nr:IS110 family transposase [candidate division KSB1 bacterium]